jgi:hypothetical protein
MIRADDPADSRACMLRLFTARVYSEAREQAVMPATGPMAGLLRKQYYTWVQVKFEGLSFMQIRRLPSPGNTARLAQRRGKVVV